VKIELEDREWPASKAATKAEPPRLVKGCTKSDNINLHMHTPRINRNQKLHAPPKRCTNQKTNHYTQTQNTEPQHLRTA